MSKVIKVLLIFGICFSFFSLANATTITYQVNNTSGNTWEYLYAVTNDTLASDIEEFTIYFDYGLYSNLTIDNPKADWDGITVQPDLILGLPTSGYYDAVPLVSGIAPGVTEGGFRVSFTWLGTGTPELKLLRSWIQSPLICSTPGLRHWAKRVPSLNRRPSVYF
jgi:hypothetical protein